MHSVDFGPIESAQHAGRWDVTTAILRDAARHLEAGGAECIVMCTNTMHKIVDELQESVTIPFLHIADPVGRAAKAAKLLTVGLLGTAFTMEQDFMKKRLCTEFDLEVLVPTGDERADIHRIIYDELCAGEIKEASRETYRRAIDALASRGAQAVILGCTEISLLVAQKDSSLPVLDTTRLHAQAAVDFALNETGTTR